MAARCPDSSKNAIVGRVVPIVEDLLFAWPLACSALLLLLCYRWGMESLLAWGWAGIAGGILHLAVMLSTQTDERQT